MTALRRGVIPFLLVLLLLIVEPGCGGRGGEEEEAWRREVDSSLRLSLIHISEVTRPY